MAITMDTTLGTLLDQPQAKAILEKQFPGITTNPMLPMIKGMTLGTIVAMPQAAQIGVTKEKVEAVLAEVNKLVK
jgi:hypothetical protein